MGTHLKLNTQGDVVDLFEEKDNAPFLLQKGVVASFFSSFLFARLPRVAFTRQTIVCTA